jgi:hypothetical protein
MEFGLQNSVELSRLSILLRLYEDYGPGGANSLDGQERMKVVGFWMYWAME